MCFSISKWRRIEKGRALNEVERKYIVALILAGLSDSWTIRLGKLCENLCEKNFPKSAKIGKNRKKRGKSYFTISVAYNNLRRLGNSEALTTNP